MVICGLLVAVLFFFNAGAAVYNQQKIGFVTQAAASYAGVFAATLPSPNSAAGQAAVSAAVSAQVNVLMNNVGLGNATTQTTVTFPTYTDAPHPALQAYAVTVNANIPTFMSSGFANLLPQQIQLSDTAVALQPINQAGTTQYCLVDLLGPEITVPLLQSSAQNLPKDGLPAWSISINGVKKIR